MAAATEFQRLFGLRQGNFLGKTKDENLTASEMGNSPEVIIKHYRALVRDADVTRYWHLAPGNVQLARLDHADAPSIICRPFSNACPRGCGMVVSRSEESSELESEIPVNANCSALAP